MCTYLITNKGSISCSCLQGEETAEHVILHCKATNEASTKEGHSNSAAIKLSASVILRWAGWS